MLCQSLSDLAQVTYKSWTGNDAGGVSMEYR